MFASKRRLPAGSLTTVTLALTISALVGHNPWQEQPYYVYSCSTLTGATGR